MGAKFKRGAQISAGMQQARVQGRRIGRPFTDKEPEIAAKILAGRPRSQICAELRCGRKAYERVKRLLTEGRYEEHRAQIALAVHKHTGGRVPAPAVVAIIGAGFSGTMVAIQLRRLLPRDHLIYLFERTGRFARGPAYAASGEPYLLNVRAANMSAFPDQPDHFRDWLEQNARPLPAEVEQTDVGTFATRRLYGRYLRQLLFREINESGGRVRLVADEVVGISRTSNGYGVTCRSGRHVEVTASVLTVGNLPSRQRSDGVVVHDPWTDDATAGLRPGEPVMVVGTGLTMVDLALGMRSRGFSGPIIAVSRRGLVPQRHAAAGGTWPTPAFTDAERRSLIALLGRLRIEVAKAAAQNINWRAVIDGLRPITAELWRGLPVAERTRFLRHLRPWWDVHRHRMAPAAADRFGALLRAGNVTMRRGRIRGVEREDKQAIVSLQGFGAAPVERLTVQRLIYATGPGSAAGTDTLIDSLLTQGLASTDAQGISLRATDGLELLGANDVPTARLWALGPIVRGVFWECTAVPDIRHQARAVAEAIARRFAAVEAHPM
jgi:uncharacterized NAD(P)/FAD-binding protein YdhS